MGLRVLFVVKEIEGAEPIGALYVAGCLREAGHDVRFVGTRGTSVLDTIAAYRPHLVAFGATTGLHRYYLGLAHAIKQRFPKVQTLFGGPHPTYYPECILSPGIDFVCQGEGEDAAVELCHALDRGEDPRFIRDLWVKHDGRVFKNPPRPLRRDLDAIPIPPRELLYEYDDLLRRRPLKSFTTNRGCPFPCSYCFNPSLVDHYGSSWKKVRVRSPANVVDEVVHVQRQGPLDVVGFRESIFVYSKRWLREFGERYRSEVRLPFYCHLRADTLDEEMVALLAWAGCHTVNVGIETASERVANEVLHRNIKMDRLAKGIRLLKKAGIVVFADNILGIPGGTLEDDLATLKLNIDLDVDYAAATLCTPYPRTRLADYAIEKGYFSGDFDAIHESYYTESVLEFSSPREKRQIENLHKVFAVAAALPALLPVWKRLLDLPPNDFFYAVFRSWYLVAHFTDVMPRRMDLEHAIEGLRSVFGVFNGSDDNQFAAPAAQALVIEDAERHHAQRAQSACASDAPLVALRRNKSATEVDDVR